MMWRLQASSVSKSGHHPIQPNIMVDGHNHWQPRPGHTTTTDQPPTRAPRFKCDAAGISAVPPYHSDYAESAQHEYGGEVDFYEDDGERFSEYEKVR
jgi:hypothetical protein